VRGLEADGQESWRHEDPETLEFITAGERLAYARRTEEGTLVVLDTSQGVMVHPYDTDLSGPLGVPEAFSAQAAAAANVDGARYLVTTTADEESRTRWPGAGAPAAIWACQVRPAGPRDVRARCQRCPPVEVQRIRPGGSQRAHMRSRASKRRR